MAGFLGSDRDGRTASIPTSFIAVCKRLHLNPFTYLRHIPDNWKPAQTAIQNLSA